MAKRKQELTAFQQETLEVARKILEYKTSCEANVCAILYKEPDLLRQSNLTLQDFHNNCWRCFFEVIYQIILVEKKNVIDDIIFGTYLSKHLQLKKVIDEVGGYQTILDAGEYVKIEAFDGYLTELRKWGVMIKLAKHGWIDKNRMSDYADMTAQDIYDELEVYINDIFINIDNDVKSYDIADGLDELVEELDKGLGVGLPYKDLPMLTAETGGMYLGGITLIGGLSNAGKSSFVRNTILPSIIKHQERLVMFQNEEGTSRTRRELIISVANNILGYKLQKHVLRDGHFDQETRRILQESVEWIKENTKNHLITIVPFQQYRTDLVIKCIKKYASMGVKYFILDTFKMDAGKVSEKSWLELQQNMVAINDVIKPEANNLHITITFQLAKGSAKQRFYTQDNIGVSKNIVDPVSTCIMIRDLYEDEKVGGKRELKVYKLAGKNGKSKVPVKLDEDKHFQVLFVIKNREGSHDYQLVCEHSLATNEIREVGITRIAPDTF